jgi:hypothetical protein
MVADHRGKAAIAIKVTRFSLKPWLRHHTASRTVLTRQDKKSDQPGRVSRSNAEGGRPMNRENRTRVDYRPNRPVSSHLHPTVYKVIASLALWFTLSAWGFFGRNDVTYALAVVSGFVFAAVFIPFQLWRVRQHGRDPRLSDGEKPSRSDWLAGDFDTWQARMKGRDAIAAILLPIASVAFGMTAFALVLHVVGKGGT